MATETNDFTPKPHKDCPICGGIGELAEIRRDIGGFKYHSCAYCAALHQEAAETRQNEGKRNE